MNSCIYEGAVRHRRFRPREHSFRYLVFMMYLDLAELEEIFADRWFWSTRRFNLAQFRRRDHFGDPALPLRKEISDLVWRETGRAVEGPIRLLTHLRYFGYCFNPVSFYFCFDREDRFLETIVAEVNNTPWNEQHCYVLDSSQNEGTIRKLRFRFDKVFHVSPFMEMALRYDWRFTWPGNRLTIHMENQREGATFFDVTMSLVRSEINGRSLASVLARYPMMTAKVVAAIYWNAFRLWLKKLPVYTHPAKLPLEGERT